MNLLPLAPPDYDTNVQSCLAATQNPSGTKSEEIEAIYRAYMAPGEFKATRTTDPIFILREKGGSSRNLLIRDASYDQFSPFNKSRQLIWKLVRG